jgi:hypothetical protein
MSEYYNSGGYVETSDTSMMQIPTAQSLAVTKRGNRFAAKIGNQLERVNIGENAKAQATSQVIFNTTALSGMVDNAARYVPSAEAPCRVIVNNYAASSSQKISDTKWW